MPAVVLAGDYVESPSIASKEGLVLQAMPLLDVDFTDHDSTIELALTGEIDVASVGLFEGALAEAMHRRPETLVVDLSAVEFLGTSCIHLLASAAQGARAAGVLRFVVVPPAGHARRALDAAGGLSLILSQPETANGLPEPAARQSAEAAHRTLAQHALERGIRRRPPRLRRSQARLI